MKRLATDRGHTKTDWLDSYHTFSFGEYYDRNHMGFRSLRVLNDDIIKPGEGFGQHEHNNMEILSYVLKGQLEHKDSMGNSRIILANSFQYISAGSGVVHSEFNSSTTESTHFFQIWLLPNKSGGKPQYVEKDFIKDKVKNGLTLLFAEIPREKAITIQSTTDVFLGKLNTGKQLNYFLNEKRGVWLHLIYGNLVVAGETLGPGDGISIEHDANHSLRIKLQSFKNSEFLLFDMK